jgi:hypothetical protein
MAIKKGDLRIVISNKKDLTVSYTPKFKKENHDNYLKLLLSGFGQGMVDLLAGLPMLRPATEREVEEGIYIFADPEKDNELYKIKKAVYQGVVDYLDRLMHALFPDIMYINGALERLQERSEGLTPEEAEEFKKLLEEIKNEVQKL